jgi:hypothetical protein
MVEIFPVAVRAYCQRLDRNGEPLRKRNWQKFSAEQHDDAVDDKPRPRPRLFIAFDTEAATDATRRMPGFDSPKWSWRTQNLILGVARIGLTDGMLVTDEFLFYPDDLPAHGRAILQKFFEENTEPLPKARSSFRDKRYVVGFGDPSISRRRWKDEPQVTVWMVPLSEFLKEFYRIAVNLRGLVIGFNLPFDLSRLAERWAISKSKHNAGAWSLTLRGYTHAKSGLRKSSKYYPQITIKKAGPQFSFISFTGKIHGEFLDLSTLAFVLTNSHHSLASALETFCKKNLDKEVDHGVLTPDYITYARNDVKATVHLAGALLELFDRHSVSRANGGKLSETKAYTPASLGKAYPAAAGFKAPSVREDRLGPCCAAFHGGWSEVAVRGRIPVVLLDFKKMYQTQWILQNMQRFVSHEKISFVEDTENVRRFLEEITLDKLSDQKTWPLLNALCWVIPNGDILITKARFNERSREFTTGMVPRYTRGESVAYYLTDLVLSKLPTRHTAVIHKAERIVPDGEMLPLSKVEFPGGVIFDPSKHDIFKFNVEEGEKLKRGLGSYANLPEDVRKELVPGIKGAGNSGAYGIFAEANAVDLPGNTKEGVILYSNDQPLPEDLRHPEQPGRFSCPPIAGMITAGARLMLGIAHKLVMNRGGLVAFGDTDSLAIVTTENGGPVRIRTERLGRRLTVSPGDDRDPEYHSLSVDEIKDIVFAFEKLNPYDQALIPGSIIEVKTQTKPDKITPIPVWALCVSTKRYCLWSLDDDNLLVDRKESILGMILSPLERAPGDDKRASSKEWITEAWKTMVSRWDANAPPIEWGGKPAIRRMAVSSPAVMNILKSLNNGPDGKSLPFDQRVRPFNFFIAATARLPDGDQAVVAPFERDPEKWSVLEWTKTNGEGALTNEEAKCLKTIGQFLTNYMNHYSPEWLDFSGAPCSGNSRGVFTRRPLMDGDKWLLTKEGLTWSNDPARAFERDEPLVFKAPTDGVTTWKSITVPTIKALGVDEVAHYLKMLPTKLRRLLASSPSTEEVQLIQRETAIYAHRVGILTDDPADSLNSLTQLSNVPERVRQLREFIAHSFKRLIIEFGSAQSLALRMSQATGRAFDGDEVYRWSDVATLPRTVAKLNGILHRLAAFSVASMKPRKPYRMDDLEHCRSLVEAQIASLEKTIATSRLDHRDSRSRAPRFFQTTFPGFAGFMGSTAAAAAFGLSPSLIRDICSHRRQITRETAGIIAASIITATGALPSSLGPFEAAEDDRFAPIDYSSNFLGSFRQLVDEI